jgi:hypothetical protein
MDSKLIIPYLQMPKRAKSPDIVDCFIKAGAPRGVVKVENTGRDFDSVYSALFMYLKSHPELEVTLVREDGDIVLYRRVVGEDSTICDAGLDS